MHTDGFHGVVSFLSFGPLYDKAGSTSAYTRRREIGKLCSREQWLRSKAVPSDIDLAFEPVSRSCVRLFGGTTAFPAHDTAHDTFMALPPYIGPREGIGSSIGGNGPTHGFRAFEL